LKCIVVGGAVGGAVEVELDYEEMGRSNR